MKHELKDNGDSITYSFTVDKNEMALCEFSQDVLRYISDLEKSPSIANQLELLLEYFHAIEGSNRVTSLAQYMRYIQATYKWEPPKDSQEMSGVYSTRIMTATAGSYHFPKPPRI